MIILGTRGSKLALIQAEEVKSRINDDVSIRKIKTSADRFLKPLQEFEEKGIFVKEIEEELLKGNIDLAVHSMKDIPIEVRESETQRVRSQELMISAVTKRISPYDVIVSKNKLGLFSLPKGARIGTGSMRRKLAIQAIRPELEVVYIRGNIETRIKMLEKGLDAIVVSEAALIRLSLSHLISEIIPEDILLPAPGQGSLGIQIRENDKRLEALTRPLNDRESEVCIKAERSFMSFFGQGCSSGISALAKIENGKITLKGCIFLEKKMIIEKEEGNNPIEVGKALAEKIKGGSVNGYC
ncbi:MAG: hydroxymethylbilane synthase [bacterium]